MGEPVAERQLKLGSSFDGLSRRLLDFALVSPDATIASGHGDRAKTLASALSVWVRIYDGREVRFVGSALSSGHLDQQRAHRAGSPTDPYHLFILLKDVRASLGG